MQWERVDGRWNASFNKEGNDMTACYNVYGKHIDSRMPLNQTAVPNPVINHLRARYPGETVHTYTKIDVPHGRDVYRVNLSHRGVDKTIYVDRFGHERYYATR
jgi:hypothetical protein